MKEITTEESTLAGSLDVVREEMAGVERLVQTIRGKLFGDQPVECKDRAEMARGMELDNIEGVVQKLYSTVCNIHGVLGDVEKRL